jgi:hypothetical protein
MPAKPLSLLGLSVCLLGMAHPASSQSAAPTAPDLFDSSGDYEQAEDYPSAQDSAPVSERHWQREVKRALAEEQFARLDEIAAKYRADKSRLPGGEWQLQDFYSIVDSIGTTDAETEARIALLHRWIAARPESITPRVALGGVYHRWAWRARGGSTADQVTLDGWRLFHQRLALGAQELTEAQKLHESCPHLYFEWLTLGLGQDWEPARMRATFEQGVKAEPGYVLDYQLYANYLQPKWDGQPGEASAFAKSAADRLGGVEGDMIYYQIALILIHHGNPGISAKEMDWARIQRGYTATKERFGVTGRQENRMAYMAWKFRDAVFAEKQFQMLGGSWSKTVWHDRATFDKARAWAAAHS